ncbi:MAG: tRNA (guanosine(37)-N1)-methyltransferase TrmD [Gammaproteobacteria bacterium RIFCSPHIGHO2_12_FULL_45_12]|nr:MAG: tRNA (guanosine(37)-N1)-methyltransferase TrmD [Gammaproteobacteria bacterium RIFCSPHIGHO2_12_FULL_45_12]
MWLGIVSLFPDMFQALDHGITGRALKDKLLTLAHWNPRQFTLDKHQTVDSSPYGGGPGMVMMAEPLHKAIHAAKQAAPTPPLTIYLSPQGKPFNQAAAAELVAQHRAFILVSGRYEGIDERVIQQDIDEEWSIGDYILSGGELAAMVMIDVMTRLIPGAIGDAESVSTDSHTSGLLKYPQYTRPDCFNTQNVPPILLSGHHAHIAQWRLKQSLGRTWLKRPDILAQKKLSESDMTLLTEFINALPQK